jgi:hypothetical protein
MNYKSFKQQLLTCSLIVMTSSLVSISTTMNHRLVTSSPLQYKQIDYAHKAFSFEIEAWASGMFDPQHTMGNLGIDGKNSMVLSQQGYGDFNTELILLAIPSGTPNYLSTIQLTPELMMYGELFHVYKQFEHIFFDIRTALISCATTVNIQEFGGGNGAMPDLWGNTLYNAHDAFTQADWAYGKFGDQQKITGFDNIQVMLGSSTAMESFSSDACKSFIAGFGIIEIPTGAGTKAEWLFEPQVGTNHWAFGFGGDCMVVADNGFSLVAGGNYRYMLKNWETRSFDLTANGQWSRYLALDTVSALNTQSEGTVPGLPGINLFTQDALINGRGQLNVYARLQKRFENCLFELSYNYFFTQKETISTIDQIAQGFGIYDTASGGGVSTSHLAQIWQRDVPLDDPAVSVVTSDLNLNSACQSQFVSNTIAARLQRVQNRCTYGVGGSVDLAASAQAISTWSVWLNLEVLLP